MQNTALVSVISFWQKSAEESGLLSRKIVDSIDTQTKEIIDIVGPRRSGKSSVMKLLIKKLKTKGNCLYINFEDPYFLEHNTPQVIEEILQTYLAYFEHTLSYIFFDEIQNIDSWEKAIRKLRDGGHYKIFLSGSSSKLLSNEFATLLTGRHLSYQLLPLSFREYLSFHTVAVPNKTALITQATVLQKHLQDYLNTGGFPAVVLSREQELLKQYYIDMVQRDIVRRYDVRETAILEQMGVYLLTNAAKTVSFASLQKLYGISYELASTYVGYFKEAFLLFDAPQFSYSLKTQQKALKKIFAVDTGLAQAVSFRFSQDLGRILEASVFLELKRRKKEIFYYKTRTGKEVDFIIKNGDREAELIQVSWGMDDEKTKQREITALTEAMEEQSLKKGLILTWDTTEQLSLNGKQVIMQPVYEWLLKED